MASIPVVAGPVPTPIPVPPEESTNFFTEEQWRTCLALVDAVLPAIVTDSTLTDKENETSISQERFDEAFKKIQETVSDPPSMSKFEQFLKDRPARSPAFVATVKGALSLSPEDGKNQLRGVLDLLGTQQGSLELTGYDTPVADQPLHVREAILKSWSKAGATPMRMLAKSIVMLALSAWVATDPLFAEISGYSEAPHDYQPVAGFDYEFLQFGGGGEDPDAPAELETDVVIVGSGCGGAVCAKVLAEAGHRVVVVDKGYYFAPSRLPMTLATGPYHLFENNGVVQTDDGTGVVLAGSCWGGGGTVNWSVGLQTQDYVREEWAAGGLPFFTSPEFQQCLDRVCAFMGVGTDNLRHTPAARALLDGARALGWPSGEVPQNAGGQDHYCGRCHMGCGSNQKQGPATSWLPHAARSGARFVEGFAADRVVFDRPEGGGRPVAAGVVGTWTSRDADGGVSGPMDQRTRRVVSIRAKKVIVSSGTLNSPLLLLRSGLKNPNIGQHLHIHPCNLVSAYFRDEVKCWEGPIISTICTQFENLDGKGHGPKLETTCGMPPVSVALQSWTDGLSTKLDIVRFRHMAVYITLTRDRDEGRVYPDPVTGRPRLDYSPSAFDAANAMEGIKGFARILYASGAAEIQPTLPGVRPFVVSRRAPGGGPDEDPEFAAWLRHVEAAGNAPPVTTYGSAHQMGTCRMSSGPEAGVVDPRGRAWEAEGLFVADASVFPSASGVNPMVTNMAIADHIAREVAAELEREG